MNWIINRLREPSTLRGLIVLAGIIGYQVSPELQDALLVAVPALIAVIEVVRKEKPNGQTTDNAGTTETPPEP